MFALSNSVVICFLVFSVFVSEATALEYLDPRNSPFGYKGLLNDSIPLEAGERIVMERERLPAKWVVAVINLPYEKAQKRIKDLVMEAFGIRDTRDMSVSINSFRAVDLHEPQEPLF